jgi:uncharacterized membrane protein
MVQSTHRTRDLPERPSERSHGASARGRLAVAVAAGAVAGGLAALFGPWHLAPIIGWDTVAIVYTVWMWCTIWPLDAESTAATAVREDPTRASSDVLLLAASVASLAAVGLVISKAGQTNGAFEVLQVGLPVTSVVLSWLVLHTLFTLRYARLYYTGADGGVDFNQDEPPRYSDFAYLAFTIGMTFQVSDTDLQARDIRATALRHALLSYLFGAVILATTINLIAGLSK